MKHYFLPLLISCMLFSLLLLPCHAADAIPAEAPDSVPVSTPASETGETDLLTRLYAAIADHGAELLSALSFAGALLVAFSYKRGLLPLLKQGLDGMVGATEALHEKTEKSAAVVNDSLQNSKETLEVLTQSLSVLRDSVDTLMKKEREKDSTRLVMSTQIELLYEVFMTSALPQFEKERIGRLVEQMRAALEPVAEESEDA